jgi:hypothetical protein
MRKRYDMCRHTRSRISPLKYGKASSTSAGGGGGGGGASGEGGCGGAKAGTCVVDTADFAALWTVGVDDCGGFGGGGFHKLARISSAAASEEVFMPDGDAAAAAASVWPIELLLALLLVLLPAGGVETDGAAEKKSIKSGTVVFATTAAAVPAARCDAVGDGVGWSSKRSSKSCMVVGGSVANSRGEDSPTALKKPLATSLLETGLRTRSCPSSKSRRTYDASVAMARLTLTRTPSAAMRTSVWPAVGLTLTADADGGDRCAIPFKRGREGFPFFCSRCGVVESLDQLSRYAEQLQK